MDAQGPTAKPGTRYQLQCLTADWSRGSPATGLPPACSWKVATCLLEAGGLGEAAASANCSFDSGPWGSAAGGPGLGTAAGNSLRWTHPKTRDSTVLRRFVGELSGLWDCSGYPHSSEFPVVVAHDAEAGTVVFWWMYQGDPRSGQIARWRTGVGTVCSSQVEATCDIPVPCANRTPGCFDSDTRLLRGTVSANFSTISGVPGWTEDRSLLGWSRRASQMLRASTIRKVHLVFSNHLDIGYSSFVNTVVNQYLFTFFPQVSAVAKQLRERGEDRLVYMTHPWLLDAFFSCPCQHGDNSSVCTLDSPIHTPPRRCPTEVEEAALRGAIARGEIVWQATPANLQAEYMEPWLFSAGLNMSDMLSSTLSTNKSLVMNLRDVIYTSRAVIPLLAKAGKRGISIGSNGCNHPAQVPKLHRWVDHDSGASVVVMYHAFGYGGYGKSVCDGPGRCGDCAEAPNGGALCTEFRVDNSGPPASAEDVLKSIEAVRAEYPDAIVESSTFTKFLLDIQNVSHLLPEVSREVGDTW
jgi:hypothetical protein